MIRTQQEIDDVLNKVADQLDRGSRWPGSSYEEGVDAALRWALGETNDDPMEDVVDQVAEPPERPEEDIEKSAEPDDEPEETDEEEADKTADPEREEANV